MTSVTTCHHVAYCSSSQSSLPSAVIFLYYCNANVHLIVLLCYILEEMKSASSHSNTYNKLLHTCANLYRL